MATLFHFRYFSIDQTHSALKVGTDAMVLGALVKADHPSRILDIGTGTGVLALMLAQKFDQAGLTAIDNDAESLKDCHRNFECSPWSDRLCCLEQDVFNYAPERPFDLIVSNPPYYEDALLPARMRAVNARHTHQFSLQHLFDRVREWLTPNGHFWVILPIAAYTKWSVYAVSIGLFPVQIIRIQSKAGQDVRIVACFGMTEAAGTETETLVLRNTDNRYTDQYRELTRDFHNREV